MTAPRHDLAVLGAGPAGASAALEAAALGLSTILLDEAPAAGGQVQRAPSPALRTRPLDAEAREGDAMRAALTASRVECRFERRVWTLEHGFGIGALGPDGPERIDAACVIVAAGATERHLPTPGWTLPGVVGLAAATILLKAEGVLPGRRVVVAGSGPLLYLVAAKILAGGGSVVAVVDARRRGEWLAAAPAFASRPDLAWRGAGWIARLRCAGVTLLGGHAVTAIEGHDAVAGVQVAALDARGVPDPRAVTHFEADAVCLGYGLLAATEATRLLGARHVFEAASGGWVPVLGVTRETTIPGLFACGDGAGIAGAAAAPLSGRIAAIGTAARLGKLDDATAAARLAPLLAAHGRAARFGRAMTELATPPPGLLAVTTEETLLCRCEGVTRATVEAAIAAGAQSLLDIKAATRCGMGPCGGRICAEPTAMLLAATTGRDRSTLPPATSRPPLRPVSLAALAGDFRYEDIPISEPAPL